MPASTSRRKPGPFADSVAYQIREARISRGITLSELHRVTGVSRRHLAELENGANVSLAIVSQVMDALGITTLDLGGSKRLLAVDENRRGLLAAAEELEQAGALVFSAAGRMRTIVAAADPRRHHREEGQESDLVNRAASLVEQFSNTVHAYETNPADMERIERFFRASQSMMNRLPKAENVRKRRIARRVQNL